MELKIWISFDVDTGDEEVDAQIFEIAAEEARKFTAALADRLEDEGVESVRISLNEDDE